MGRSQGCQFRDAKTGKICGSKRFLDVDHIQPRFAGGGNEPFNLRPMCSSHNKSDGFITQQISLHQWVLRYLLKLRQNLSVS
ncbi:MAG: HNH endonuclease [Bdellovibrionaceae bacterium]|nr:HNH endonuclease [Pseudobdellovibrionaceae bacterium]